MTVAVLCCLATVGVFVVVGPIAGRRLPPAVAVRVLVADRRLVATAVATAALARRRLLSLPFGIMYESWK